MTQRAVGAAELGSVSHPLTPPLSQVLLAISVWFCAWLVQRSPLPPHFRHFRLRLRGQIGTLLAQRRWEAR